MAYIQDWGMRVQAQPQINTTRRAFLHLSQNENGRMLNIRITDANIPAGSTAVIAGTKPDGTVYSQAGTLSGNTATFAEDVQMTAVAGTWDAKITVTNGGNCICTARITITVDPDTVAGGAIPSDSQLDGIIAECRAIADSVRKEAYGSPLVADAVEDMTDQSRVYVYTGSETGYTSGHWYYYNGSAWADGGVYNAVAVDTDTTLSIAGKAADAKEVGDQLTSVKEDLQDLQNDTITSANMFDGVFGIVGGANVDGTFNTNTRFMRSDYLPLKEGLGRTLYMSNSANAWASVIVYAEDKSCFGAIANGRPLPDEARYFVVTKAKETTADFYVGISPFSDDYSYSTAKTIKPDALQNGLRKKSVVLMGDSTYAITGKSGARISDFLALLGDCAVTNCSFGGTRLSDSRGATSVDSYKPFDFPNLVDAIVANDFTTQNNSLSGKTSEYITNLSNLESVDFSKVDCLILAYGANDFTGNANIGTNTSDRTTLRGALIYGVETLLSAFPNLMIVVDGQRYRAWLDASTKVFVDDVFTHRNNNDQLTSDYINALESQCTLMGVPYFNNLYHYGWNKYTRINYFPAVESGVSASSADGAHFDVRGVKYAASVLYKNLCMLGFAQNL